MAAGVGTIGRGERFEKVYKPAKKLSESIKIMSFMVKDNHIDPDIFRLFLKSSVYPDYAEKFLKPEQIDEVDLSGLAFRWATADC